MAIWDRTLEVTRSALARANPGERDRRTRPLQSTRVRVGLGRRHGAPVYPAIGWQDLRTVEFCNELGRRG